MQVSEVPVSIHTVSEEQEKDFKGIPIFFSLTNSQEHPIQVNAVWNGVCSEGGCPTVDMTLHITEMDDNRIKGEVLKK